MKIYQLNITILDSNPSIWRRVLIGDDTLLPDLHKIIQSVMGWTNSHMHQFIQRGVCYGASDPWGEMEVKNYEKIKVSSLLKKENDRLIYEYDFGDNWAHDIVLEKISEKEEGQYYPVCIDGENACPPEDCGGIWGYEDMLMILNNPGHEEYEDTLEWLGDDFDPQDFNKEEVNQLLQSEDFGVVTFFD